MRKNLLMLFVVVGVTVPCLGQPVNSYSTNTNTTNFFLYGYNTMSNIQGYGGVVDPNGEFRFSHVSTEPGYYPWSSPDRIRWFTNSGNVVVRAVDNDWGSYAQLWVLNTNNSMFVALWSSAEGHASSPLWGLWPPLEAVLDGHVQWSVNLNVDPYLDYSGGVVPVVRSAYILGGGVTSLSNALSGSSLGAWFSQAQELALGLVFEDGTWAADE